MRPRNLRSSVQTLKEPLKKRSVVHLVIERIKEAMIAKELKPGDYLPSETELTKSLGVGKTSVREAIKMLEAMGIVEIRQGHGTYIPLKPAPDSISPLTFQLILEQATNEHLLELRKIFEPAYALLAMEKATAEDVKLVEEAITVFEEKIKKGIQTAEDDLLFHERMLECTHNPFIIRIGNTIHQLFRASVAKSMQKIPEIALRDHKAILEAFASKNPKKLLQAIQKSYKGWEISLFNHNNPNTQ
ncbi:MAG: FadR/GntR family transcriptional regulator [Spirochaetales bacterium]